MVTSVQMVMAKKELLKRDPASFIQGSERQPHYRVHMVLRPRIAFSSKEGTWRRRLRLV